jgi:hypothetical protein
MATSVTISPTLGHAPLFTQDGVGASPGYDAIDLRRIAEASGALQEGVFDAAGWQVTQRGAGANMTVDVAASTGLAVVQGDSVTAQSRYVIPPHSAVANLDIGSNATGNPRIDQVVLQVRDDTHDGSGSNDVRVLVLAGTATSGATLDNRTGAASLPVSAIRLADVLVASGTSSITTSAIRDRRPWARGASWYVKRATTDYSTVSSTYALIDSTNLSVRIECSGLPVELCLNGRGTVATNTDIYISYTQDSAAIDGTGTGSSNTAAFSAGNGGAGALAHIFGISLRQIVTPTAGSHVFAPAFRADSANGATIKAISTDPLYMSVREIALPNASNS